MGPACFIRILLLGASLALTLTANALAQGYPVRPIKLVVPYPAGGSSDSIARVMAQKLTEVLGQQIIVENRSGASTIVAAVAVAKSPSDGYTLFLAATDTLSANPALHRDLPYDPLTSFAPISMVAATPLILVAHPSFPANNLKELVALVAAKQRAVCFWFIWHRLDCSLRRGNVELRGGDQDFARSLQGRCASHSRSGGRADPTGNRYGGHRSAPDQGWQDQGYRRHEQQALESCGASTIAESGYPQYDVAAWFALVAPAGTPEPIVKRLRDEVTKMQAMPDVKDKFTDMGAEVVLGGPDQYNNTVRDEIRRYSEIVRRTNMKPE